MNTHPRASSHQRAAAGGVLLPAPGFYYQPVHKG